MAINKVNYGNTTLIDLTADTVTAETLMQGYTAHDRSGAIITGTATGTATFTDVVEPLPNGGDHHIITGVNISDTTAVASDVANGKYFYAADGTKTLGTASGGGGLEYEEGIWTPTEDVTDQFVSFSKTHTELPCFMMIMVLGGYDSTEQSPAVYTYCNYESISGEGVYPSDDTAQYGLVAYYFRATSTTSLGGGTLSISVPLSTSDAPSAAAPRYWVTETGIYFHSRSTSRLWRAGKQYKWFAVWAPAT